MKLSINMVLQNTSWQLGNGTQISFWTNHWLSQPLVGLMHIPEFWLQNLSAMVKDFIHEGDWHISDILQNQYSCLEKEVQQIRIPKLLAEDHMVWNKSDSGMLTHKEAYLFQNTTGQNINWGNINWHRFIPPSKSFLSWRVFHNKLPT